MGESAPVLPCRHPSMHGGVRDGPRALKRADGMLRFVLPLLSASARRASACRSTRPSSIPGRWPWAACSWPAWATSGWRRYMLLLARTQGYVRRRQHSGQSALKLPVLLVLSAPQAPQCR
ncbi:MAG: hypothetical protein ACLSVD_03325 [Eggerthellaceae bacterium]